MSGFFYGRKKQMANETSQIRVKKQTTKSQITKSKYQLGPGFWNLEHGIWILHFGTWNL
jgi:hypothetical protein